MGRIHTLPRWTSDRPVRSTFEVPASTEIETLVARQDRCGGDRPRSGGSARMPPARGGASVRGHIVAGRAVGARSIA